jgi:hypothetical protein
MLREGEISGVELMALLFPDVTIYPIELEKDYSLQLSKEASVAPVIYLLKIAQQSLREEHVPTLQRIQPDMKRLEGQKEGEAYQKKVKEMYDYILSADPWAQTKAKLLQDVGNIKSLSGEEHLKAIQEIEVKARRVNVEFEPEEQKAMRDYVAFWQSRIDASKTMIGAITPIADKPCVTLVAMNIGAAHTKGMCAMLAAESRPYAVVTPLSLKNNETKGDIGWEGFETKYKAVSIYSDPGLTESILRAFPHVQKKPPQTLTETWLQAKSEVYLVTQKIAEGLFGPPDIPNGGAPPFGFSDDAFRGRWVFVDPRKIELVDEPDVYKGKAAVFPVVLMTQDENKRQTVWAKAALTGPMPNTQEDIVAMLEKARTEVLAEGDPKMKEVVSDRTGKKATSVRITLNSVGLYAGEKATVQSIRAI